MEWVLKVFHWAFIISMASQAIYGFWQLTFVVGGGLIFFSHVWYPPFEVVVKRRLYSIESWMTLGLLGIYLALTEILPRKLRNQSE